MVATAVRNLHMLRVLERIALRCAQAGVDLLALKGAALNLTVTRTPAERPMGDLDLLVRVEQLSAAQEALAAAGCRPGKDLVREDFFPRYCFEREYVAGRLRPVTIDLHVAPLRPLRFARLLPSNALWDNARRVAIGAQAILIPGREEMLIHLAAHSALHGNTLRMWRLDLLRWVRAHEGDFDWDRFVALTRKWGLALPVRSAISAAESDLCPLVPREVASQLAAMPASWRDRWAMRQAPQDAKSGGGHVLTDALCTPGARFVAGYLAAALVPDRRHMAEWYDWRHVGWRPAAQGARLLSPLLKRAPWAWNRLHKLDLHDAGGGQTAVCAARVIAAGECIAAVDATGKTGRMRHSCRPNARREGELVRALRAIDEGEEVTLDHGLHACGCRQGERECA